MGFKFSVNKNKANQQLSILLQKRKIKKKLEKYRTPKFIVIKDFDFEYD